jgi:N-formylglutamate deformylase
VEPYFVVTPPRAKETPVVVEIPHAGLAVPPQFAGELLAPARSIARDADLYVDELYDDACDEGATLVVARVSRYVVDLNRAETDVDAETVAGGPAAPRAPRGVVWRLTTENERTLAAPLSPAQLEARLAEIYRPYHAALADAIRGKVERFGVCVLLAGHSMPSVGRSGHGDTNARRADVVPGTQGRTTARGSLIDAVERHARDAGLSVRHDEPYRGGWTTRHWGRPGQGIHAIQVEIARRLYMDEAALVRGSAFEPMRKFARELVAMLGREAEGLRRTA